MSLRHLPLLSVSGLLGVAVAINRVTAVLWTMLSCHVAMSASGIVPWDTLGTIARNKQQTCATIGRKCKVVIA